MNLLYVKWQRAKLELEQALFLTPKQQVTLHFWFERHAFEYGCTHSFDRTYLEHFNSPDKSGLIEHGLRNARFELIESIAKNKLISRTENQDHFHRHIQQTVLVFGAPDLVGPGTRDIKANEPPR